MRPSCSPVSRHTAHVPLAGQRRIASPSRTLYPSQTKILERGTKDEIRMFESLFKGVSTRFGLRIVEKSVENPDCIFCSSFQNLRLGSMHLSSLARHTPITTEPTHPVRFSCHPDAIVAHSLPLRPHLRVGVVDGNAGSSKARVAMKTT